MAPRAKGFKLTEIPHGAGGVADGGAGKLDIRLL